MNTVEQLKEFIIDKYFGFQPNKPIAENTRIGEDLGIDGDDAVEFFEKVEEEFKVDFKDLNIGKYFNGEGFNPILFIVNFFSKRKPSITIKDIANSIEMGKWIDPK
jgi:acyl carrier protein